MTRAVRYTCDYIGCTRWINVHADTENDFPWEVAEAHGWTQDEYGDDLCPKHSAWVAQMRRITEGANA